MKKQKQYWTAKTNRSLVEYKLSKNNQIFTENIYPAFKALAAGIINKYKTSHDVADVVNHLFEAINTFKPDHRNPFSYFSSVARNYCLKSSKNTDDIIIEYDHKWDGSVEAPEFYQEGLLKSCLNSLSAQTAAESLLLSTLKKIIKNNPDLTKKELYDLIKKKTGLNIYNISISMSSFRKQYPVIKSNIKEL